MSLKGLSAFYRCATVELLITVVTFLAATPIAASAAIMAGVDCDTSLSTSSAVYESAEATFARKFEILKNAKHSILISTFSIKPDAWYARDPIGKNLADILIEKHKQGLEVKVFTDYWGNPPSTRAEVKRMIAAGVDVRYFGEPEDFYDMMATVCKAICQRNMVNLNHGKTMVVDGWHTFTGGYNWMLGKSRKISSWRDTDFYIGGPVAEKMSEDFYSLFETLPKQTSGLEAKHTKYVYPKQHLQFKDEFYTQAPWLRGGNTPINDRIISLINRAQSGDHIYWQSFAFRLQRQHLEAMKRAAYRGVKFTILTNSYDHLFNQLFFIILPITRRVITRDLYNAAHESYSPLLSLAPDNPTKIYEFHGAQGPLHAKAILLLKAATVKQLEAGLQPEEFIGEAGAGTYNVSPNSWDQHIETMMFTNRPLMVQQLYELYQRDIAESSRVGI